MNKPKDISDGWVLTTLGEIAVWGSGGTPKRSVSAYFGGDIPWVTIADLNGGMITDTKSTLTEVGVHESAAKLAPKDSVLIALYGSIGKLGIAGRELTTNQAIAFAFPNSDWFDKKYLFFYLMSQTQSLNSLGSGVTQKNIYLKTINNYPIPFAPIKQQTRIMDKLEELFTDLDNGVSELKAAQVKLGQYRQSLLKSAVDGSLTKQWRAEHADSITETGEQLLQRILKERRERWQQQKLAEFKTKGKKPPKDWQQKYPEPVPPVTTDLPELPESWVWATVDQLSSFTTSGSRGWAKYYSDSGALFIRAQNIKTDELDLTDTAYVDLPNQPEGTRTLVSESDILLTVTGANVGKCAYVRENLSTAYVSQHVALIRLVVPSLTRFVHMCLINPVSGRAQLNKQAYGAGKPGLNLRQVAEVTIPLPSKSEGETIMSSLANEMTLSASKARSIEAALKLSELQRKNILKSAFSGELVPQDPNDEPARVLLERIREERVAYAKQKKAQRGKVRA